MCVWPFVRALLLSPVHTHGRDAAPRRAEAAAGPTARNWHRSFGPSPPQARATRPTPTPTGGLLHSPACPPLAGELSGLFFVAARPSILHYVRNSARASPSNHPSRFCAVPSALCLSPSGRRVRFSILIRCRAPADWLSTAPASVTCQRGPCLFVLVCFSLWNCSRAHSFIYAYKGPG